MANILWQNWILYKSQTKVFISFLHIHRSVLKSISVSILRYADEYTFPALTSTIDENIKHSKSKIGKIGEIGYYHASIGMKK